LATSDNAGPVLHVPLGDGQAALEDAAPLGAVLASVGSCKQGMLAAIEGLEAEPTVGGGQTRALGDALRAVLRWVATGAQQAAAHGLQQQQQAGVQQQQQQQQQGEEREVVAGKESGGDEGLPAAQGFPGMRLLLFLAGPPNCGGSGSVVARCPRPADAAAEAQAAQQATEQAAKELASLVLDPVYPELSAWTDAVARSNEQQQQRAAAAAAAAALASAGDLSHAAPPGVSPQELTVNLAAAEFYAEAGAAAAALGLSVDIFAACPQWMGECLTPQF
jgi:hypothetical protein